MTQQDEPPRTAQRKRGAEIMLQNLPVGTWLILRDGAEVEIVENPRVVNGSLCRPGSSEDPELVSAADIAELPEQ